MKLSVIIVNYNVRLFLEQCLLSVKRAIEGMDADIWVVDNHSTDDSVEYLSEHFPEVRLIANRDNHGFSYANNQAIRQSEGEYVLLLNPDTLVGEDVLKGCVDFLDAHPQAGGTGVRMLNADGRFANESRRGIPTPFTSFCKMSGLGRLFPKSKVFGHYYMKYLDIDTPNQIEIISGAFMMMRRKALDQIGLLDETFFMYGEDIDISYRLLQEGWQNWYLPLNILHYKGESTVKNSFHYVHTFYNAMLIFFNKHYGKKYFILGQLIRLAVCLRASIDLFARLYYHMGPTRQVEYKYVRYDLSQTPTKQVLEELRKQPEGFRRFLETTSADGTMIIRHTEVVPYSPLPASPKAEE